MREKTFWKFLFEKSGMMLGLPRITILIGIFCKDITDPISNIIGLSIVTYLLYRHYKSKYPIKTV